MSERGGIPLEYTYGLYSEVYMSRMYVINPKVSLKRHSY